MVGDRRQPLELQREVDGGSDRVADRDRAVVGEQRRPAPFERDRRRTPPARLAAEGRVGRDADAPAERGRRVVHGGDLLDERGEHGREVRVGVDDGPGAGGGVDGAVQRGLRRRPGAVGERPVGEADGDAVLGLGRLQPRPARCDQQLVADAHAEVAGRADDEAARRDRAGTRRQALGVRPPRSFSRPRRARGWSGTPRRCRQRAVDRVVVVGGAHEPVVRRVQEDAVAAAFPGPGGRRA